MDIRLIGNFEHITRSFCCNQATLADWWTSPIATVIMRTLLTSFLHPFTLYFLIPPLCPLLAHRTIFIPFPIFSYPIPISISGLTFWRHRSADWDGFPNLLACYPWYNCHFVSDVSMPVWNFTDTALQTMHFCIPQLFECSKPRSLD